MTFGEKWENLVALYAERPEAFTPGTPEHDLLMELVAEHGRRQGSYVDYPMPRPKTR